MLKVISLHTLKSIFEVEGTKKVSPLAQMCYINCLMYHFEDKPANIEACGAFDLQLSEMKNRGPNFKLFCELQEVGLVTINAKSITFKNHWHKHIDKEKVIKASPEEFLGLMDYKPAADFKKDIIENRSAFELLGMRHKLKDPAILVLLDEFMIEQAATRKHYVGATNAVSHFLGWVGRKAPTPTQNTIKSGNKLM